LPEERGRAAGFFDPAGVAILTSAGEPVQYDDNRSVQAGSNPSEFRGSSARSILRSIFRRRHMVRQAILIWGLLALLLVSGCADPARQTSERWIDEYVQRDGKTGIDGRVF